jgi:mannose-6-phosphate isomerase-like protein (cupin superfamily)
MTAEVGPGRRRRGPRQARGVQYDATMTLALLATLPLLLTAPTDAAAQTKPRTTKPAPASATTTATITVTDQSGAPVADARVVLTGDLDRSGSTQSNGTVKFDTIRPGTYRVRIEKEGYVVLEREFEWRAGQPGPAPSVALSPAPRAASPPPPPAPAKTMTLPPPGQPVTLALPDYIERNFIANTQPQKVSPIGCSGLSNAVLWQIREPWENRQHAGADAMLYVIGGEGALRLDNRDTALQAGSFASVPRGLSYSLTRRGRSPLIVLAVLAGEACVQ